jgi:hypothetical protein
VNGYGFSNFGKSAYMLVYVKRSALGSVMFQGPLTSALERGDSVVSSEIVTATPSADDTLASSLPRSDSVTKSLKLKRRLDDGVVPPEADVAPDKKEDSEAKAGPGGDSPTLGIPSESDPFVGAFIKGRGCGCGCGCVRSSCGLVQILMLTCPWMFLYPL